MNPLTNVKNQNKINQRELELGLTNKKSWHDKYKDSAWIFIGGLPYDLTEGDVLCIFSQYGEIVNINLVRDQKTGKSKGFCFLCYEDQRSTILAVDNFNGAKILGRIMRVDHVEEYKKPKEHGDEDEITMKLRADGCAPKIESSPEPEDELEILPMPSKKVKKAKKEKKKKKKKKKESSSENSSESEDDTKTKKETKVKQEPGDVRVKKEKYDAGYDKALKGNVSGNKRHYSDSEDSEIDSKYSRSDVRSQRDQRNFDNNSERGQERQRNRNDINRTHDRDRNNDRRNIYEDRLDKGDRREEQRDRNNRADTRDRDERRGRDRDDKGGRDWDERRGRDREVEPRRDRDRSDRGYRR